MKIAIITGLTLGFGKASALLFAQEGASVIVCDHSRTRANAEKLSQEAKTLPSEVVYHGCEIIKQQDINSLGKFTLEKFGKVDMMVNNAIIDIPGARLENVLLKDGKMVFMNCFMVMIWKTPKN